MDYVPSKMGKISKLLALVSTAVLPSAAGITVDQYATPYVYYTTYVDFAATSSQAGHDNFAIFNTSEHYGARAVKYFEIPVQSELQSAPLGNCIEISTTAPATGISFDSEILVRSHAETVWRSLSDDYNGTRFSKARLWLGEGYVQPANIFLRVAAYDGGSNTGHFNLNTSFVRGGANGNQPITTEADCFAGDEKMATAFVDRHEDVWIRRNSTF
jgi:hypothetical protein